MLLIAFAILSFSFTSSFAKGGGGGGHASVSSHASVSESHVSEPATVHEAVVVGEKPTTVKETVNEDIAVKPVIINHQPVVLNHGDTVKGKDAVTGETKKPDSDFPYLYVIVGLFVVCVVAILWMVFGGKRQSEVDAEEAAKAKAASDTSPPSGPQSSN